MRAHARHTDHEGQPPTPAPARRGAGEKADGTSGHGEHDRHGDGRSLNRLAVSATTHCMTGCGIGEVLGLVIANAAGWGTVASIAIAVALAFLFGYALTMLPLLRAGLGFGTATGLALAADTASITVMEIVDNAIMLAIPGAMSAGLGTFHFWGSLALALAIAWVAAFPLNRWLISRGMGHARVHAHH